MLNKSFNYANPVDRDSTTMKWFHIKATKLETVSNSVAECGFSKPQLFPLINNTITSRT